jgi:2-polyprenyl-3-methyl-5-hydroxy-6-metoxy-1,4-benzoquinol methylase
VSESIPLNPIRAEKFLCGLKATLAPARGTYIFEAAIRDSLEKTSPRDTSGYVAWLRHLYNYLSQQDNLSGFKTLDVGCGSGALTVLMKLSGFDAMGIDVQAEHIGLAKILAEENGLSPDMFVCHEGQKLPFADQSFDVVTMISVLEHLDDLTLKGLVPELARICRGVLVVQAPNSAAVRDDHTGLLFVPSMPRWLARAYVAGRGERYQYRISASGAWDVHYRNFDQVIRSFHAYFDSSLSPAACCYPQTPPEYSPTWIGKHLRLWERRFFVGLPLPWRQFRINRGYPKEAYYPYLNLLLKPKSIRGEN